MLILTSFGLCSIEESDVLHTSAVHLNRQLRSLLWLHVRMREKVLCRVHGLDAAVSLKNLVEVVFRVTAILRLAQLFAPTGPFPLKSFFKQGPTGE